MIGGRNQAGFTLIETMVAMLIIAISLLALAGLLTQTIRTNQASEERLRAAAVSQELLDLYASYFRDGSISSWPASGQYAGFSFVVDIYSVNQDLYAMHVRLDPYTGGRMAPFDNSTVVLK